MRRGDRDDHTLQPTALANETYLRLRHKDRMNWRSRAHSYAVASGEMRRILMDHARPRAATLSEGRSEVGAKPYPRDTSTAASYRPD
jgi:RNA polymerase sigma-70 factor (ECF subfamily)